MSFLLIHPQATITGDCITKMKFQNFDIENNEEEEINHQEFSTAAE
jgi:hypothetical protein